MQRAGYASQGRCEALCSSEKLHFGITLSLCDFFMKKPQSKTSEHWNKSSDFVLPEENIIES